MVVEIIDLDGSLAGNVMIPAVVKFEIKFWK